MKHLIKRGGHHIAHVQFSPVGEMFSRESLQSVALSLVPDIQSRKHVRGGHFGTARGAVITFQGKAQAGMRDATAEHAFRTNFDEKPRHGLHDLGVKAACSCNQEWMRTGGTDDPLRCFICRCR